MRLNLTLHCYHQNDSCIEMGGDESLANVSLTVINKVTIKQYPQTTILETEES